VRSHHPGTCEERCISNNMQWHRASWRVSRTGFGFIIIQTDEVWFGTPYDQAPVRSICAFVWTSLVSHIHFGNE